MLSLLCILYFDDYVHVFVTGQCTLYHVCGDNIDKGIKSRYMRVGKDKPQDFHSYAVADRLDFTSLSDQVIPTRRSDVKQIALSLLPTTEDDQALRHNIICVLMSRILYQHCDFFNLSFDRAHQA